jgi:hypothetical protein
MYLKYKCENEDCPKEGEVVDVTPGVSVECEECGWFMTAV